MCTAVQFYVMKSGSLKLLERSGPFLGL